HRAQSEGARRPRPPRRHPRRRRPPRNARTAGVGVPATTLHARLRGRAGGVLEENRAVTHARFRAFITEKHPFAARALADAGTFDAAALRRALESLVIADGIPETTPCVSATERLHLAIDEVIADCAGFFRRQEIAASLTTDEKIEMLRGMVLTRAVDNRLKQFFTGGEVRWGNASFQGKGFRCLGQEAIYAAPMRLRRGANGDVVSPMIRDLGAALSMNNTAEMVRAVLNAQMGKAGPPMNG